jgi:hypothetical protein
VNWDLDVDVVCTGFGVAGLATAVAVVDHGGSVFVDASLGSAITGTSVAPFSIPADPFGPWLLSDVSDAATSDYLSALAPDRGPVRRGAREADVTISVVQDVPVEAGRTIEPFVGARLRDWAARCLASPYGFLHTRLADFGKTTQHIADGERIAVAIIGSMSPDFDDVGGSVLTWVTAQARDRAIEMEPDCSLERLVFEDGEVVGAVFGTPNGPLAVHARLGVTVATASPRIRITTPPQFGADVKVCLVGRQSSRFGRLELVTSEPLAPDSMSPCRPDSRQVRANLRETSGQSPAGRCARGDGYPNVER